MKLDFSAIGETTKPEQKVEKPEPAGQLTNRYKREQGEQKQTAEIYKEYQRNIKASEELQAEIMKGLQSGEPVETLLLKAIKAITAMTNNKVFADQAQRYIKKCGERKRVAGSILPYPEYIYSHEHIPISNPVSRDDFEQYRKDRLVDYLRAKMINPEDGFQCLNPEHEDNKRSMSIVREGEGAPYCHCPVCGVRYDTLDLIGMDYPEEDPGSAFRLLYNVYAADF